jgi:hypothetical protein
MEIELNEKQQAELEVLKKKYGKVKTLFVPLGEDDEDGTAVIFIKNFDKNTRGMVDTFANKGQSDKAIEVALKALYIGGDDIKTVLDNDYAFASADYAIAELLKVRRVFIKKN